MKIKTVSYSRLRSFGDYENERIEATAEVEPGESEADAMDRVKTWVYEQFAAKEKMSNLADLAGEVRMAERRLIEVNEAIDEAKAKWEKARAFLEKHGLSTRDLRDDMPF